MVSDAGSRIDLTKTKTILELNTVMADALKSGDIIGVSLKLVKNAATIAVKNVSAERHSYKFISLTVGKKGFTNSGDSYILFDGGEIQFRTFGSTWQGEIKGKNANMGKISGGPINTIMKNNGIKLLAQNEIVNKTPKLIKEFYKFYKHFDKTMSETQFETFVNSKDQNWWVSKFLSTQLMYYVDTYKDKNKFDITSTIVATTIRILHYTSLTSDNEIVISSGLPPLYIRLLSQSSINCSRSGCSFK
jgi:hypothetical protein